jgi:uncharacterized protein YciI
MAVREAHLALAKEMFEAGKWLYACGILDDDGQLNGSMIVCDFASRNEMDQLWLSKEPYIRGDVWQTINIHQAQVPSFLTDK